MYIGTRFSFWRTLMWSKKYVMIFVIFDSAIVLAHSVLGLEWLHLPWQPISLIGIAVAFYLGFKNNSSYDRLWEARKIWGGIVNASRSFTVMARDFIINDEATVEKTNEELIQTRQSIVHRHVAWLRALALEMRKIKTWEHDSERDEAFRKELGLSCKEENFDQIKPYLS